MAAIRMYCANEKIGWKPALRRIVAIVFGNDVLATSCAVGRTNAKFVGLPNRKVDVIKGMNASVSEICCASCT